VLDIPVAQIMLDRPCVLAVIGHFVTGGMAQHVRVDREFDAGLTPGAPDDLAHGIGGKGRPAFADIALALKPSRQSSSIPRCVKNIIAGSNVLGDQPPTAVGEP
jgi:hypothetical protein